jgi:hypothetical protein
MDRSLVCLISGKKYVFSKEYFEKKIEEYGGVEQLKKFFVTKKVKSLISRGYHVDEMRRILSVEDNADLTPADSQDIREIISFHKMKFDSSTRRNTNKLPTIKTDPIVAAFINNLQV